MARLIQLSDLHTVRPGTLACGVLDTNRLLRSAIDQLLERRDALGPLDAVLVTGDISDDGSPESYIFARTELERLGLPILAVPGNHDARDAFREGLSDMPHHPQTGLVDWWVDVDDTRVIGLDTLVEGQGGGRLRSESLSFLDTALADAGSRPVVVALHHPPLKTGIAFMDAIGLENSPDLAAVLIGFPGNLTVVAGHVHGVHVGRVGGHSVATAPATCSGFALDVRANAPIGFFSGPRGFAVIDTGDQGVWSAVSLEPAEGPYRFQAGTD